MIDAQAFRDRVIQSVLVSYDWEHAMHFAEIRVSGREGASQTYRINRLSELNICEDFGAMHVSQCTLIIQPGRVYLSLDPYTEGAESERDNYTFTGAEIACVLER
jgi:predicted metal-binding protein